MTFLNKPPQQVAFDLAAPAYIALSFFRFYTGDPALERAIVWVFIVTGFLLIIAAISKSRLTVAPILLAMSLAIMALFVAALDRNSILTSLLQFLANMGFVWAILKSELVPKMMLVIFAILIGFFVFIILSGVNPESVFSVSRNYISVLLILTVGLYYFSCQMNGLRPNIFVPLAALIILLWAIGRAGILSGLIILMGTFLLSGKRIVFRIFVVSLLVGAFLFFQLGGLDALEQFYVGIDRFSRLSTQSQRVLINEEYINRIMSHASEFLFGAPLAKIDSINEVNGNPHNSYIRLHIMFGAYGTFIFIGATMLAFIRLWKAQLSLVSLVFFVALFRSLFDSTAFYGPLDVLIFYSLFLAFSNIRHRKTVTNPERAIS